MCPDDPDQSPAAELGALLEASRQALMGAIGELGEEGFRACPDEAEWSAAEVLAHLLVTEGILIQQAQAALSREQVIVSLATEDERQEQAELAQSAPVPQILHGLLAQRRDTARLLGGLSPEQLDMTFIHPRRGEQTVASRFRRVAEHENEHAVQVRALRAKAAARTP